MLKLPSSPSIGLGDIDGKLATPQPTPPQQLPNVIASDQPRGCACRRFPQDGSQGRSEKTYGGHSNLSLAEKIQAVLSAIHDAGFDGLESFVSLYYTSDLTSFPNLANSRRLSRNRGLPGILVDVRQNMPLWTEWEKQRYKDEVLKSAEAILKTECTELNNNGRLRDLVSNVRHSKEKDPGSLLAEISTDLQNEVLCPFPFITSQTLSGGFANSEVIGRSVTQPLGLDNFFSNDEPGRDRHDGHMRPIHNAERDVHVVLQWHRIWRRDTKIGCTLPTNLVQ